MRGWRHQLGNWRNRFAVGIVLATTGAGCTGLEPAVIGAGASAAETSASFFAKGQVTTFETVAFADGIAAVRAAAETLRLTVAEDEPGIGDQTGRRHRLVLRDERHESTVVVVERRTEAITKIHADVGTFGPTPLASLIVNVTLDKLRKSGAYERAQMAGNSPETELGARN